METPGDVDDRNENHLSDSASAATSDWGQQLEDAIRNHCHDELQELLNSGIAIHEVVLKYKFEESETIVELDVNPLTLAVALGCDLATETLLKYGSDVETELPVIGGSVLHLAARYGSSAIMTQLLSKDTDRDQQDKREYTPLHLATQYDKQEIVSCLLEHGADSTLRNDDGHAPFQVAAMYGRVEILKILFERSSDDQVNEKNRGSNAPIHLACINHRAEAVEWLLDQGASIDQPGQSGMTPLAVACAENAIDCAKVLLKRGADVHKRNIHMNTPLLLACLNGRAEICDLLRSHGALISDIDANGNTCFHKVILDEAPWTEQRGEIFDLLFGAGLDINQPNIFGFPPLILACQEERPQHLEHLLKLGADVDLVSRSGGITALMEASCKSSSDLVPKLLEKGADTTRTNAHGLTSLALACRHGRLENAKLLIEKGSKVSVHDRDGNTPLRTALVHHAVEIAFEILMADYRNRPSAPLKRPKKREHQAHETEECLLQAVAETKSLSVERLQSIMYWAVSNGALELTRSCVSYNEEVLQWNHNGGGWLHAASENGAHEIAKFLLELAPAQPTENKVWTNFKAIIRENHQGESPLSISIRMGLPQMEKLFWSEFERYEEIDKQFMHDHAAETDDVLEALARYERPGHEDILRNFLKHLAGDDLQLTQDYTTLQWAVRCSRAAVVWWLLSKGGYSSAGVIQEAAKLVAHGSHDNISETKVKDVIRELLDHPPPHLDHIDNPNKEHLSAFPPEALQVAHPTSRCIGTVLDVVSHGGMIKVPWVAASLQDIIYKKGPDALMQQARDHPRSLNRESMHQLGLVELKKTLQKAAHLSHESPHAFDFQSPESQDDPHADPMDSNSNIPGTAASKKRSDMTHDALQLRWVHLPVNELHLMRDLVSRLSSDEKRSEVDHSAIMKHFNGSWTELAAGAENHYMKPQYVKQQPGRHGQSHKSPNDAEKNRGKIACTAVYMPYLTTSTYPHGPLRTGAGSQVGTKEKKFKDTYDSRNSRRITHSPMTLDQFYYSTITDFSRRDSDQVLSKFLDSTNEKTNFSTKKLSQPTTKAAKKSTIFVVNQLWIWIVDDRTIITAAAEIKDTISNKASNQKSTSIDQDFPGSLLSNVVRNILYGEAGSHFERATSAQSVMELIINVATGFFNEKSIDSSASSLMKAMRSPVDVFRESIRRVADEEAELFLEFQENLRHRSENTKKRHSDNRYHVISKETELLAAIRDIRDELQILKSLAQDQEAVWKQAFSYDAGQYHGFTASCTPNDIKADIEEMLSETDKIDDYISSLLDLRQAEFGRLQADDSSRQANAIFVFTLMTIVFLPLSFLVSLFALPVSDFPHDTSGDVKYEGWWLFPIIFGVTVIISVPAIIFAWNINHIFTSMTRKGLEDRTGSPASKTRKRLEDRATSPTSILGDREPKTSDRIDPSQNGGFLRNRQKQDNKWLP